MSGQWGTGRSGVGMEDTVIRSHFGFLAVPLRSRAAGRHTGAKAVLLQKTQTTPDYFASLFSPESPVDSSPDSFSPVLPSPAVATVLVRKYFRLHDFHSFVLYFFMVASIDALMPAYDSLGCRPFRSSEGNIMELMSEVSRVA